MVCMDLRTNDGLRPLNFSQIMSGGGPNVCATAIVKQNLDGEPLLERLLERSVRQCDGGVAVESCGFWWWV